MTEPRTSPAPRRDTSRGRIDKRRAILDAAFRVFAREGYGQSCVQEIAAEAGVAKPTIYNHLRDKESLFREAMETVAARVAGQNLAALEGLREPGHDVREALELTGHRLVRSYSTEESWALRRLLHAEATRFPELLDAVQREGAQRVKDTLADRLARLTLSGRLRTRDPDLAAEQFLALLTGPVETRSRLGTRQVPDDELRDVTQAAVSTFLHAYATAPAAEAGDGGTASGSGPAGAGVDARSAGRA
ncbi:TetR/AcrR family transcriptional regulator [Streptomyces sp. NPDC079020]|uniref:TetR/AcrR family transcriptional regulator n=1 Tax=Streptomyces sp. NPDC079020 TaxID=3365722 RepID=UPI0037D8B894